MCQSQMTCATLLNKLELADGERLYCRYRNDPLGFSWFTWSSARGRCMVRYLLSMCPFNHNRAEMIMLPTETDEYMYWRNSIGYAGKHVGREQAIGYI